MQRADAGWIRHHQRRLFLLLYLFAASAVVELEPSRENQPAKTWPKFTREMTGDLDSKLSRPCFPERRFFFFACVRLVHMLRC